MRPFGARAARATTAAIAAAVVVFLLIATDRPFLPASIVATEHAAFAIRDEVSAFEEWGTRAFTTSHLDAAYAEVLYVTQATRDGSDRVAILERLGDLLDRSETVDLFLLAHTNDYMAWIAELSSERRSRIRLVYDTGCFGDRHAASWIAIGAKAFVGHPGNSVSPVFYTSFLRRWARGWSVAEATESANARTARSLAIGAALSFGAFDAEAVFAETEASTRGDEELRIR